MDSPRRGSALVLDAACGAGGFLAALSRRLPAARCFGADLSPHATALARRTGLPLLRSSAALLPVRSNGLDAVILHDVLQHLPAGDDARALSEAHRVLKPEGLLSVRANFGVPGGPEASRHRRYDREGLRRLVESAGFVIEKHRVLHPLAGCWGRLRGTAASGSHAEAADSEELAVRLPGPFVNTALDVYSRLEDALVTRIPVALPVGDAQLLLARKRK